MISLARLLAMQGAEGLSRLSPGILEKVVAQPALKQLVGKLLTQGVRPGASKATIAMEAAVARRLAGALTNKPATAPFGKGLAKGASEVFTRSNAVNQPKLPYPIPAPAMTTPARTAANVATSKATSFGTLRAGARMADSTRAFGRDPLNEFGFSKPYAPVERVMPTTGAEARQAARSTLLDRGPVPQSVSGTIKNSSFASDPTMGVRPYPGATRIGGPNPAHATQNDILREAIRRKLINR